MSFLSYHSHPVDYLSLNLLPLLIRFSLQITSFMEIYLTDLWQGIIAEEEAWEARGMFELCPHRQLQYTSTLSISGNRYHSSTTTWVILCNQNLRELRCRSLWHNTTVAEEIQTARTKEHNSHDLNKLLMIKAHKHQLTESIRPWLDAA